MIAAAHYLHFASVCACVRACVCVCLRACVCVCARASVFDPVGAFLTVVPTTSCIFLKYCMIQGDPKHLNYLKVDENVYLLLQTIQTAMN